MSNSNLYYAVECKVDAADLKMEDGGMALIFEPKEDPAETGRGADGCMFVKLQSWDDDGKHTALNYLAGNRIRVSIEVIG